jgi:hypothetical protein
MSLPIDIGKLILRRVVLKKIMTQFIRIILLVLLSTIYIYCFSQEKLKIIDKANGTPLPNATLIFKNNQGILKGVIADNEGVISYFINDIVDSVFITHVGYNNVSFAKKDLLNINTIFLTVAPIALEAIEVAAKQPIGNEKLGVWKKVKTNTYFLNFQETFSGIIFDNPDTNYIYRIDKLFIGIRKERKCPCAIQIRILSIDKKNHINLDLIENKFIILPEQIQSDPITIELFKENIFVPENGFLFSVQLIDVANCSSENNDNKTAFKTVENTSQKTATYSPTKQKWLIANSTTSHNKKILALGCSLKKYKK